MSDTPNTQPQNEQKPSKKDNPMKVIGTAQFLQKVYDLMKWKNPETWSRFLGELPLSFVGIIYGGSGEGKTELCMRILKELTMIDEAAWLSYEQKHGSDLQRAIIRNKIHESTYNVRWIDPVSKMNENTDIFTDLFDYLKKKSTPRFVFVDSLDYLRITVAQYYELERLIASKRRAVIFISHAKGREPATKVGEKIEYDGAFGILVKDYIAYAKKNRYGGRGEYVIWEEEAKLRNPLYFAKMENPELVLPKKRGRKPKK